MPGLSPRLRRAARKAGRKHGSGREGSHGPARLRSQHHPRALLWHLQTDPVLADPQASVPGRGLPTRVPRPGGPWTNPPVWSRRPPARPGKGCRRLRPGRGPCAPPAWTKASFLHCFPLWFGDLLVPSCPPALGEPSLQDSKHRCGHGVHTPHLPFLKPVWGPSQQGLYLPLPKRDTENLPRTGYQLTFKKAFLSQKPASQKTPKNEKHAASRADPERLRLPTPWQGLARRRSPKTRPLCGGRGALPGQGRGTAETVRPAPREQTALLPLEARMRVSPKPVISNPGPRHT